MHALLILLMMMPVWARTRVVERVREVGREVAEVTPCHHVPVPPFRGDRSYYVIHVTERVTYETYLVRETCGFLLASRREDLLESSERRSVRVEARTETFRGEFKKEACESVARALRQTPNPRFQE